MGSNQRKIKELKQIKILPRTKNEAKIKMFDNSVFFQEYYVHVIEK